MVVTFHLWKDFLEGEGVLDLLATVGLWKNDGVLA